MATRSTYRFQASLSSTSRKFLFMQLLKHQNSCLLLICTMDFDHFFFFFDLLSHFEYSTPTPALFCLFVVCLFSCPIMCSQRT